jgi:DNA-binding Lrp family transcriptional regulator
MVEKRDEGAPGVPDPRLDDRVIDLLLDHHGRIAFNGLRRALHVHPESLTRALRRLERDGLVRREKGGYAATALPSATHEPRSEQPRSLVASIELAPMIPRDEILGALAGRWFGSLRWVGIHERPGDPWLVWSVGDSGAHVMLSVRRGTLRVYVDRERSDPQRPLVEPAAHDLLRYVLERLTRFPADSSGGPSARFLGAAPPDPRVLSVPN